MITRDQPTIFDDSKVRFALSAREDGNTKPETGSPEEAEAAMTRLAEAVGLSLGRVTIVNVAANQEVWDDIVDVTSPQENIEADALVTNVPHVGLMLRVGDCNAVGIHDPVQNVLAIVHLGWQSTVVDLATKIVEHLQHKYRCSAADLRIYFSPAIKVESYIQHHVKQQDDPKWKDFLQVTDKGIGADLPGYNRQRFVEAGVLPEHIQISPIDTGASDEYFSHYRAKRDQGPQGRFALIGNLVG